MGIDIKKYIRKPLYVDAVRVTEQNFDDLVAWCNGSVETEGKKRFIRVRVNTPKIPRQTQAFVGDWLLWTERSGFKVYTNRAFHFSFDPVVGEEERVTTPQPGPTGPDPVEHAAASEERASAPPSGRFTRESEGKRIITDEEARVMGPDEVQQLLRSGEAVLEQDAA